METVLNSSIKLARSRERYSSKALEPDIQTDRQAARQAGRQTDRGEVTEIIPIERGEVNNFNTLN